jgi:histone acetyltransferase MYST1
MFDCVLQETEAVFEKEYEQITKIRNIDIVQIGKFEVDTWYYSPYPDEVGVWLCICDSFFSCEPSTVC